MTIRDSRLPWHTLEASEERAIRRVEREMAHVESEMEHAMETFEREETGAKRAIAREWRDEHCGRDPERPPRSQNHDL